MKCLRCGSPMVSEESYSHEEHLVYWRCVFCGEYIDHVVFENRQYQRALREKNNKKREEPQHGKD